MNRIQSPNPLPHGLCGRVAELAGVSRTSVSNVLNRKPSVSTAMIVRVAAAAKKIIEEHGATRAQADEALNQLAA